MNVWTLSSLREPIPERLRAYDMEIQSGSSSMNHTDPRDWFGHLIKIISKNGVYFFNPNNGQFGFYTRMDFVQEFIIAGYTRCANQMCN